MMVYQVLSLFVLSLLAGSQGQGTPVEKPIYPPIATARQGMIRPSGHPDGLRATIYIDTKESTVRLRWAFNRNGSDFFPHSQTLPTAGMWPTAATYIQDRMFIAGRSKGDGGTILQEWVFTYPPVPATGILYQASYTKTTVLDLPPTTPGKKGIRFMCPIADADGSESRLLVHYSGSNDVYSFDPATGVEVLVFPSSQVPRLKSKWLNNLGRLEHPQRGYIYHYKSVLGENEDGELILIDSDRDGAIEDWNILDRAAWTAFFGTIALTSKGN